MRLNNLLIWGLLALLAVAVTLPSLAQPNKAKDRSVRGQASVKIVIGNNAQEDTRTFQRWYDGQVRGYNRIDPETGERYSDLLQLVEEVNNGWLIVSNRVDSRRSVVYNARTKVVFEDNTPSWTPPGYQHNRRSHNGPPAISRIRPGDLIIAQGYMNASGKFVGTTIRVVGSSWGWYDDDYYTTPIHTGYRAWGDVTNVDARREQIEVRSNTGLRTVSLTRTGVVLYNNREIKLETLRRGDRVVFYFTRDQDRSVEAYRIVRIDDRQAFPRDKESYWADPKDYRTDDNRGTFMDGRLDRVTSAGLFYKLELRVDRGRTVTFTMPRNMKVIDEDGDLISINSLREGENLRVHYTDLDGMNYALRVVCR